MDFENTCLMTEMEWQKRGRLLWGQRWWPKGWQFHQGLEGTVRWPDKEADSEASWGACSTQNYLCSLGNGCWFECTGWWSWVSKYTGIWHPFLSLFIYFMLRPTICVVNWMWNGSHSGMYISQSVQLHSRVRLFATPWTAIYQASLSITNSRSLLKLMSIESLMPSNHLILCHPLFLLPSIFPSIRIFSNESVLRIRWPKYWSFSFSISPSNEYSGLISFRMD